jgi:hypothetical protein
MTELEPTYASNAIALTDLDRFWPKGKAIPLLIGEVAALIGPWPVGAIGLFFLKASRPNDFLIENGADLWNRFGIFVAFANGTEYALWYYDGCPPGAEPVVAFGDEGGLNTIAPNLKAFFKSLAAGSGYFPKDDTNPRVSFSLTAQDETIQVQTTLMAPDYTEWEPLPERETLIPLLQRARNERVR